MATKKAHGEEVDLAERVARLEERIGMFEEEQAAGDGGVLAGPALGFVVDELRPLGLYGVPDGLLAKWLARWTGPEIVAAVNRVLATWRGHAMSPGAPAISPGADWRELAAYMESRQSHQGWGRVQYLLEHGEMPSDPVSTDPLPSVFVGVPREAGLAEMAALVPEVLRRAELGITWAGTQGTFGTNLALRKEILAAGPGDHPRFIAEWTRFKDPRLLRVLVLTAHLGLERGLGDYSFHGADLEWSLEEWLIQQHRFSVAWPGRATGSN